MPNFRNSPCINGVGTQFFFICTNSHTIPTTTIHRFNYNGIINIFKNYLFIFPSIKFPYNR